MAPNLMDYGVSLGRRFRALKLWMVMRAFGAEGLAARIREHVRLAGLFRAWVEADPAFEVAAPTPLSVVCFRARFPGVSAEEEDRRNHARHGRGQRHRRGLPVPHRCSAAAPSCAWPSATSAPRSATCAARGSCSRPLHCSSVAEPHSLNAEAAETGRRARAHACSRPQGPRGRIAAPSPDGVVARSRGLCRCIHSGDARQRSEAAQELPW